MAGVSSRGEAAAAPLTVDENTALTVTSLQGMQNDALRLVTPFTATELPLAAVTSQRIKVSWAETGFATMAMTVQARALVGNILAALGGVVALLTLKTGPLSQQQLLQQQLPRGPWQQREP